MNKNGKNNKKPKAQRGRTIGKTGPVPRSCTKLDVAAALKIKASSVDVSAKVGLEAMTVPATARLSRSELGTAALESLLEHKTPSQCELEANLKWYKELADGDHSLAAAAAVLIALRRVYAIALRQLNDRVDAARQAYAERTPALTVPDTLADFVAQYAMFAASKPFSEHDAVQSVLGGLLPWLATVVDAHTEADAEIERAETIRRNEERVASPLPTGFCHTVGQEAPGLARDRSLVLVGWRNAVAWLLDSVCTRALEASPALTTVRFFDRAPDPKAQHARLIRLAPSVWKGCANSDRMLDAMVYAAIAPVVGGPIDLIVCDDLADAFTGGFFGRPAAAQAGDAHRRIRRWCNQMQAGLLAGLPCDSRGLPDTTGPEFDQLRTFADVRTVVAEPYDGYYLVTVGNGAAVFDVPRAELDSRSASPLIV